MFITRLPTVPNGHQACDYMVFAYIFVSNKNIWGIYKRWESDLQISVFKKYFFLFLNQNILYVVGTQKNHLNETVPLSNQNTCLNRWWKNTKRFYVKFFCLCGPMRIY